MSLRIPLVILVIAALWAGSGCTTRYHDPMAPARPAPATTGVPEIPETADTPAAPVATKVRTLPALTAEPEIGVLLAQAGRVRFTLLVPARIGGRTINPGEHLAEAAADGVILDGQSVGPQVRLAPQGGSPVFSTACEPPSGGHPVTLRLAGSPELRLEGTRVLLIERIGLEGYLAGVVPVEMAPGWPEQALAAQAIVARSYAAARWTERSTRPWQLHWHSSVDMAYGGAGAKSSSALRRALDQTRGEILYFQGMPLPALFHAASGGATESAANVFPALILPDGRSAIAALGTVADPASEPGAKALADDRRHGRWKQDIPLAKVTQELQDWAQTAGRPAIGIVSDVTVSRRFADSQRVAEVQIVHKVAGKTVKTAIPAKDFRLAVGANLVPSTWWDRCLVVKAKGGTLVLQGRGFGHGVGLPQVSAWQLARSGVSADDIVSRYYTGTTIERKY